MQYADAMSRAELQVRAAGPAVSLALATIVLAAMAVASVSAQERSRPERPNILWLSSEDNGPHLGAYGDTFASTPNLDRLAARGIVYRNAWSNAPVCAPARTTIISGLYPTSTGSQHMRSQVRLPAGFRFFPQLLRAAGYYATNNAKEDYNLEKPGQVWDDSSRQAHWRNRAPGQPFFAVFNFTVTHESQIRRRPHTPVHSASEVPLPAYHPDTPEVRRDWAQYYDKMAEMDAMAGERLRELEQAGLADSTIIFYWGDHGIGLPRGKRTALDTGLRVPLIVSIPERFQHLAPGLPRGSGTDRLVGFIDFAPTMLSLAGVEVPQHYQGSAFLGRADTGPSGYLFGFAIAWTSVTTWCAACATSASSTCATSFPSASMASTSPTCSRRRRLRRGTASSWRAPCPLSRRSSGARSRAKSSTTSTKIPIRCTASPRVGSIVEISCACDRC